MRPARRGGQRLLGWVLFFVWAVSLSGLQALVWRDAASAFVPDAALVLAVVVLARAEASDLVPLAFLTACARAATSGEAPLVLVTGALGALFAALLLRGVLELSGALGRTIAALVAVFSFEAWIVLARGARAGAATLDAAGAAASAIPIALASALAALLLGPLLARLPGLTPLWSRSW
ncbi:MAG: hypothetical protein JNK02_14105 [Planctomycetes bacterium]|nr:hypothetical protein [Planctomycetota bacterium]